MPRYEPPATSTPAGRLASMAATRSRWPGSYCGNDRGQRVTRTAAGSARSPMCRRRSSRVAATRASSSRSRARSSPVAPERGPQQHLAVAAEVRPLRRCPRARRDVALLGRGHEVAAAVEPTPDAALGHGEGHHRHRGVADRPQPGDGGRGHLVEAGGGDVGGHGQHDGVGGQAPDPVPLPVVHHGTRRLAHPDADAVVAQRDGEAVHDVAETAGVGEEDGGGGSLRPVGAQAEEEAAVAGGRLGHLRGGGGEADVGGIGGVDRSHEGADEAVVHLGAEAPPDRQAEVVVAARAREQRFEGGAGLARPRQQPAAGQCRQPGGEAEDEAGRDRVELAVPPQRRRAGGRRHQLVAEAELPQELPRPRAPGPAPSRGRRRPPAGRRRGW